ncbi:MAG TPA: GNAT family N-acetyltransferase, partial [Actinotalea sp.]
MTEGDAPTPTDRGGAAHQARLVVVPWDDPHATLLRTEQQDELTALYDGEGDIEADLPPEQMLATVLVTVDDEVAGCGALREAGRYGMGYGELKRMYVRPPFRGRGMSRLVVRELERIAAEAGFRRLILETGVLQVEAIGLYRSSGYRRIPNYGPYVDETRSVCYARWLVDAGTKVVVVNGTMGAGKTTVSSAISDLLREGHEPHGWIDADVLCQVWPTDAGDPYAQDLMFESLTALAPNLARRGLRRVVLP